MMADRPLCQCGHSDLEHKRFSFPYTCSACHCAGWIAATPQGGDEHVIISADRPVEYGTLDGNTIKVRS